MKDTYKYQGQRKLLVKALRQKGIKDEKVLDAIGQLPRHFFFEKGFEEWAYKDQAFPIKAGQTISQPYTVAFQTELLQIQAREKVLEIGTGSGYQAAILAILGARVFTLERQSELYDISKGLLKKIGLPQIRIYLKDGYKGLPEMASFDKILLTAGAEKIPQTLLDQLKVGGVLVAPVGKGTQDMIRVTKESPDTYRTENFGKFKFVPFLKGLE